MRVLLFAALFGVTSAADDANCGKWSAWCRTDNAWMKENCKDTCAATAGQDSCSLWKEFCGTGNAWVDANCQGTCNEPAPSPPPPSGGGPVDCDIAEPQSPRDITPGSKGLLKQKVAPIAFSDAENLVHVNTHFHWGAEHKSSGEYDDLKVPALDTYKGVQSGFFCSNLAATLTAEQNKPYEFKHCHDVHVGSTYEFHWVLSGFGMSIGPGLGGAFAKGMNAAVAVRAQVFTVANADTWSGFSADEMFRGATFKGVKGVSYIGSTTGKSFNNKKQCSPFNVNWQVDPKCRLVSAQVFDEMCKMMKEKGLEADTHPHDSRELVAERLSVDTLVNDSA